MSAPDPRKAVVDRREQLAGQSRPTSHTDVGQQVQDSLGTDDLVRLYRPEWVIVHTETHEPGRGDDRVDLATAAQAYGVTHYAGRIHPEDMRVQTAGSGTSVRVHLQLRLPTLKGEFTATEAAHAHAAAQGWQPAQPTEAGTPVDDGYLVVTRNSRDDHDLRAYSVKKLPTS